MNVDQSVKSVVAFLKNFTHHFWFQMLAKPVTVGINCDLHTHTVADVSCGAIVSLYNLPGRN